VKDQVSRPHIVIQLGAYCVDWEVFFLFEEPEEKRPIGDLGV
jgi:hypothetical protein